MKIYKAKKQDSFHGRRHLCFDLWLRGQKRKRERGENITLFSPFVPAGFSRHTLQSKRLLRKTPMNNTAKPEGNLLNNTKDILKTKV